MRNFKTTLMIHKVLTWLEENGETNEFALKNLEDAARRCVQAGGVTIICDGETLITTHGYSPKQRVKRHNPHGTENRQQHFWHSH